MCVCFWGTFFHLYLYEYVTWYGRAPTSTCVQVLRTVVGQIASVAHLLVQVLVQVKEQGSIVQITTASLWLIFNSLVLIQK